MNDPGGKGSTFISKGLQITLLVVIIGAGFIAILKAIYPQVPPGQYLTLVTVCAIIAAFVLDFFIRRWTNPEKE